MIFEQKPIIAEKKSELKMVSQKILESLELSKTKFNVKNITHKAEES